MTNKITLADLLENQPDILKDAFKLIDKQGQLGVVERQAVDETHGPYHTPAGHPPGGRP